MPKDIMELHEQFEEYGYVTHECEECGDETLPTEPDAYKAFCTNCDKYVDVEPLI